ncbi:MAG: PLP-dependent aminotransferase family protein, partial [Proteobacteria bacterium]|nr:PLP-dependent aminotransferase family protein [Pseudomonadota bacterium]
APRGLLQYGPSEGELDLRTQVAGELTALGLDTAADRIIILSGSQQGIDLAAKLVVDPGVAVAVESPSYLAALQVFRFFGARFPLLDRADPAAGWEADPPALAYVTPTFQNPTGHCWSAAERQALAAACDVHDVILFEDDPYRDLAYDPCERRPICADVKAASWIYQGSFSKTAAPGLRLGFLTASPDLYPRLLQLKQAADLHTNRLAQWTVLQFLTAPDRAQRMSRVVAGYRRKRDLFAEAMARHLTGLATWHVPPGGLFFWVDLDPAVDVNLLFQKALERGVLFTPGEHFLAAPGRANAMRLNFSAASPEDADRGLAIIGELARELSTPPG